MTTTVLYGAKHGRFITKPLDPTKCGTTANHRAHLRRGQPPCDPCQQAANAARRNALCTHRAGCTRRAQRDKLCARHYRQQHGHPANPPPPCTGCGRRAIQCRNLCSSCFSNTYGVTVYTYRSCNW